MTKHPTTDPAVRKLHDAHLNAHAAAVDAAAAAATARTAAAEPKPAPVEAAGPAELERARLRDEAGLSVGEHERLQRLAHDAKAALQSWRQRTEKAAADVQRHEGAERFHLESAREAKRLEVAALSAAAERLLPDAKAGYAAALAALRERAAELTAAWAVASAASNLRQVEGTPAEDWTDPIRPSADGIELPSLGALNSAGAALAEGEPAPWRLIVTRADIEADAVRVADRLVAALRGDAAEVAPATPAEAPAA